jgi:hypothetical protein
MPTLKFSQFCESTKTEYQFSELPPAVQTQVLDKNRDINIDDEWFEWIIEEETRKLQDLGFEMVKIQFSGFYSQGDGASFTGDLYDSQKLHELVTKNLDLDLPREVTDCFTFIVQRTSSRYVHERTVEVVVDYDSDSDEIDVYPFGLEAPITYSLIRAQNEIEAAADKWVVARCQQIYHNLEKEHDALISDESVADTIEANEMRFDLDGNIL